MIYVKHISEVPIGTLIKYTSACKTKIISGTRTKVPWNDRFGIVTQQTDGYIVVRNINSGDLLGIGREELRLWQVRRFK